MVLPHGTMGWSAVCDCGIPDHTHLDFVTLPQFIFCLMCRSKEARFTFQVKDMKPSLLNISFNSFSKLFLD